MKRLKYLHIFNGRYYPLIAAGIATTTIPLLTMMLDIDVAPGIIMPVGSILALVVCFLIEHHLSNEERQIIAETPMPLWKPVNSFVRSRIITKYEGSQFSPVGMIIGSIAIGVAVFVVGILPGRHSIEMNDPAVVMPIAFFAAVIAFVVMFFYKGRGANWLDIDDSAMYTVIPVHHCYEVKHYYRHRSIFSENNAWYTHFLVFYQPDGKYVLKLPDGHTTCSAVIIVLYHGSVTWLPVDAFTPEDML